MTFRRHFNERKAAQAAAYLLKRHGGRFNYMALIKLLYLADRKKLIECGSLISTDRLVSMPHGPALSEIYRRISEGPPHSGISPWFDYISAPTNYEVSLLGQDPETDELSRYELRILDSIDDEFGSWNVWDLRDYVHRLPEYEDPHGSSHTIPIERILRVAGKSSEEIAETVADFQAVWAIDRLAYSRREA